MLTMATSIRMTWDSVMPWRIWQKQLGQRRLVEVGLGRNYAEMSFHFLPSDSGQGIKIVLLVQLLLIGENQVFFHLGMNYSFLLLFPAWFVGINGTNMFVRSFIRQRVLRRAGNSLERSPSPPYSGRHYQTNGSYPMLPGRRSGKVSSCRVVRLYVSQVIEYFQ